MVKFLTQMVQGADVALRNEHAWLLKHESTIVALVDGKWEGLARDRKQLAQQVYDHLLAWGVELAWFTNPKAGKIKFSEICDYVGQNTDRALEERRQFFKLPFPPRLVYFAMRRLGARNIRRTKARS